MSNTFTLDALINETVRRYAPVEVDLGDGDIIELKALMRLGEKERKSVIASIEEINDLDYDVLTEHVSPNRLWPQTESKHGQTPSQWNALKTRVVITMPVS